MTDAPSPNKDFTQLRKSGMAAGTTKAIGMAFVNWRTQLATLLVNRGVRPNHLTITGFIFTFGAAACFVMGASQHAVWESPVEGVTRGYWPWWAVVFLFLAGACDMLDGAVARIGQSGTAFGGVLDSTVDRLSDIAVYLGMCIHFAWIGNVTYAALAVIAMANGYMISYVKARAEDLIDDCSVGYWLRGERCTGLLLASAVCHLPAWLWVQAIGPVFTIARRVYHAYRELTRPPQEAASGPDHAAPSEKEGWFRRIIRGDTPRGSIPYDVLTFGTIAFFTVAPWVFPFFYGTTDPLRSLLDSWMN